MPDLGYAAAFLGGVLTLLSPCSALLLPAFFAYAFSGRTALVARTGVFSLGLCAVLVPLGAGSGALAGVLTRYRAEVVLAAGVLIIVLGVVTLLGGGWAFASAARVQSRMARRGTWVATLGLGAVYGLAGFCSGPILGAVLTVAAASGQAPRGAALLAVYAVGMAVPLFVLALLWERFDLGRRPWLRGREVRLGPLRVHSTSALSGLLFVVIGVLFIVADGTAGLLGTDPARAAAAENTAVRLGGAVGDLVALAVAAVIVVGVVVWRLLRAPSREPGRTVPTTSSTSGPDDLAGHDPDPPSVQGHAMDR